MRTIKFRGKNTLSGKWVYGTGIQRYMKGNIYITDESPFGYDVVPETVGQFTSLYDKNHNEIYEGDILAAQGIDEKLEVRFVRGVFAFLWSGDLNNEFPTGSPTHEWAEVIGNIYDNPDLIKKGGQDAS